MRSLTKTLLNKQRARQIDTDLAVQKSVNRYLAKMAAKGWQLEQEFAGDAGEYRKTTLWLYKLSKDEAIELIAEYKALRRRLDEVEAKICENQGIKCSSEIDVKQLSITQNRSLVGMNQHVYTLNKRARFYHDFYDL